MESESLVFTGLEIPRDYYLVKEGKRLYVREYGKHK